VPPTTTAPEIKLSCDAETAQQSESTRRLTRCRRMLLLAARVPCRITSGNPPIQRECRQAGHQQCSVYNHPMVWRFSHAVQRTLRRQTFAPHTGMPEMPFALLVRRWVSVRSSPQNCHRPLTCVARKAAVASASRATNQNYELVVYARIGTTLHHVGKRPKFRGLGGIRPHE